MNTYTEEQGKELFDWRAFLNKSKYTHIELYEAASRSHSWVTCACGNQCKDIPRSAIGCPEDNDLASLGIAFHTTISKMARIAAGVSYSPLSRVEVELKSCCRYALEILERIEAQSAFVLTKLNEKITT